MNADATSLIPTPIPTPTPIPPQRRGRTHKSRTQARQLQDVAHAAALALQPDTTKGDANERARAGSSIAQLIRSWGVATDHVIARVYPGGKQARGKRRTPKLQFPIGWTSDAPPSTEELPQSTAPRD